MLLPKHRRTQSSSFRRWGLWASRPADIRSRRAAIKTFRPQLEPLENRLALNYSFGATPFQWVELNGDPKATVVIGYGDDWANPINIGSNAVTFYGNQFGGATGIWASTNGLITFGNGNASFLNGDLLYNPGQAAISPLWEDYYQTAGNPPMLLAKVDNNNHLIIEWNQVHDFVTNRPVTFEVIIQLNTGSTPGNITFNYLQLDYYKGSSASVGIKDGGIPAPYNAVVSIKQLNPLVDVNQAILFSWDTPVQPPVISFLGTSSAAEGSPNLTLTVNGSKFASTSVVQFNGTALSTSYISNTQLQATIPASLLAEEGNFNVTVMTPGSGGGTSNAVPFAVTDASLTPGGQLLSGTEGQTLSNALVATFTDPGTDGTTADYSATVTWDDGNGQSHTSTGRVQLVSGNTFGVYADNAVSYSEEGTRGVTVAINDVGGSQATVTSEVTVADAALTASGMNISATEGAGFSGPVASFSDADLNGTLSDYSATIDWGDGQSSSGTIAAGASGSFIVSGSHTYAEEGTDSVSVHISDAGGATIDAPLTATVADASLSAQGANVSAIEGAAFSPVVATFTDANLNATASDFSVLINWGDGQSSAGVVTANGGGAFTVTGTHTYLEEGNFSVGVSISDQGGSTASAAASAAVTDAALSASGMTVNPLEGNNFNGTVATFTDADPNGTATDYLATINWGDGTTSSGTIQANNNGGFDVIGNHAFTEEGTTTVTVTIQDTGGSQRTATAVSKAVTGDAPLSATGVIASATEGVVFNGVVASFTDGDRFAVPGDYMATIDWGDGFSSSGTVSVNTSGVFLVMGTHTYAEEGTQTVKVNVLDDGNSAAGVTSTMNIGDAGLSAAGTALSAVEGAAFSGTVATFTDANANAVVGNFSALINWGDGITTAGTVSSNASGGFQVSGSHTYAEEGTYNMTVTISDVGGAGAVASSSTQVADAGLSATPVAVASTEGVAFSGAVATFTDADANAIASDFTAVITWGDGHSSSGVISANANGGFTVSGANSYAEEGSYSIAVQITDAGGATTGATSGATVADASLQASGTSISAVEGNSFAGIVASFTDSYSTGPSSDLSATISWGDGSSSQGTLVPLGNGQFSLRGVHTYAEEGNCSISVQITDGGGASTSALSSATVSDAALSATMGAISAVEGASFTGVVATFQDANLAPDLADYSATISWGDGASSSGTISAIPSGGFQVTGTHTYVLEHSLSFSVTITDKGIATAAVSGTASVADAPLSAQGVSLSETQGTGFTTFLASFTDANLLGAAGDFKAVITWGDGSTSNGTVTQNGAGSYSVVGNHTYTLPGNYSISTQIFDAGGATATANSSAQVVPLGIVASGTTTKATEGIRFTAVVANFTDTNTSLTASAFSALINWADGSSSAGTIAPNSSGGFSVTGSHTFADAGTQSISVTIRDNAGATALANSTVLVADSIPVMHVHVRTHYHHQSITLKGTFSDSAVEDHKVVVNWGDGITSVVDLGVSRKGEFSLDHQYSADFIANHHGKARITIRVIDDEGTSSAPRFLNVSLFDNDNQGDNGHHHQHDDGDIWDIPGLDFFNNGAGTD